MIDESGKCIVCGGVGGTASCTHCNTVFNKDPETYRWVLSVLQHHLEKYHAK
jgi:hypothetical protein